MTDEAVLAHWDREVPVETLSLELAKVEGTLKGVATCLREAGVAISEYSGFGDDLRFFAEEVAISARRLTALRERLYA